MNKRGIDCVLPRANSRCLLPIFLSPGSPFFLLRILLTHFFIFSCTASGFEPLTSPISLAYPSLYYTTTLQGSVEIYPSKTNFYFTWLVRIQKNLHHNLLIHVFNACCTPHENMHRIYWSLGQIDGPGWRVQERHVESLRLPKSEPRPKLCRPKHRCAHPAHWKYMMGVKQSMPRTGTYQDLFESYLKKWSWLQHYGDDPFG